MAGKSIADCKRAEHIERLGREDDYRSDKYVGTKVDLIGAGFAKDGQFPGDPGRSRGMVTYDANGDRVGQGNNRRPSGIQIQRVPNDKFVLSVFVSAEERARRQHQWRLQREATAELRLRQEALRVAAEETEAATNALAAMPTPKAYAKQAADKFWTLYLAWMHLHGGEEFGSSGHRFDEEDVDYFRGLATDLYYEIKKAAVISDRATRLKRLHDARVKEASLDPSLQLFIRRLPTLPAFVEPIDGRGNGACARSPSRRPRSRRSTRLPMRST